MSNWKDDRTLVFNEDGPLVLHALSLGTELGDAVGDKPNVRFLDGVLISLHFHVDLDDDAKSAVETLAGAHDGSVALAADALAVEQHQNAEAAKRADLDTLRQKRRSGQPLTPAEQAQAIDLLLGV